jgi:tripartite ATP-independent transporter DctM subunit
MIYVAIIAVLAFVLVTGALLGPGIGAIGLAVLLFEFNGNFNVFANAIWNIFSSSTLIAVPVFMLLGEMLGQTGIAKRIYAALTPAFEHMPGKLLQVNVATCTVFSALNGSSMATTAAVGSIAFHELDGLGYDRRAVVGSIVGGGSLGMLIPPSVIMIIYASLVEVSVGNLFVAGILPGLMIAAIFMSYIAVTTILRPTIVPPGRGRASFAQAFVASLQAWPFIVLIMAILGTILLGWATPTEAAALGVATTLILGFLYRELTLKKIWGALRSTAIGFGSIMLILIASITLFQAVALAGLPEVLLSVVAEADLPPWAILVILYLMYLGLGAILDGFGMMLITLPIVFPLVTGLGYDPVWFGIVVVLLIETSVLTPPVGFNLFVIVAVSRGKVTLGEAARAAIPYWLLLMFSLTLLTLEPRIATFLPQLAFPV